VPGLDDHVIGGISDPGQHHLVDVGAREVGFTVLSISLSLIAVFLPILLMGGILGRLFREFAVTLSVAILISMVVSLTRVTARGVSISGLSSPSAASLAPVSSKCTTSPVTVTCSTSCAHVGAAQQRAMTANARRMIEIVP